MLTVDAGDDDTDAHDGRRLLPVLLLGDGRRPLRAVPTTRRTNVDQDHRAKEGQGDSRISDVPSVLVSYVYSDSSSNVRVVVE